MPYPEQYLTSNQSKSISLLLFISTTIGTISLLKFSLTLLNWVYVTFFRPDKNLNDYGSWAVVTGATDGIGKAFAFRLADKGLNLVLVGRNQDKLNAVCRDISAVFSRVEIRAVVVDLSRDSAEWIRRLEAEVGGLDVGLLVNNAGATYAQSVYFHEAEEGLWGDVLRVNVEGTTSVSRVVMRGMVERRRGAVVNIGSAASVVVPSFPLHAIYASTKGYINQLSRSLYVEYKNMGIDVQCQIPLYVATKMVSRQPSTFVPSPDKYAHAAMRWIGYEPLCTPYWPHSIQWGLLSLLPNFILNLCLLQVGINKRRLHMTPT